MSQQIQQTPAENPAEDSTERMTRVLFTLAEKLVKYCEAALDDKLLATATMVKVTPPTSGRQYWVVEFLSFDGWWVYATEITTEKEAERIEAALMHKFNLRRLEQKPSAVTPLRCP